MTATSLVAVLVVVDLLFCFVQLPSEVDGSIVRFLLVTGCLEILIAQTNPEVIERIMRSQAGITKTMAVFLDIGEDSFVKMSYLELFSKRSKHGIIVGRFI